MQCARLLWPKLFSSVSSFELLVIPKAQDSTKAAMGLSKVLQEGRSLPAVQAKGLGNAYLPCDGRAKAFHGLGPGSSMTEAGLAEVLQEMDQYLVVDDYGAVERVKYAREEYNKRPGRNFASKSEAAALG